MITVGMNYEVREGKSEPFEKKFAQVMTLMAAMSGHLETRLYRDVFRPNAYLIVSEWESRPSFDAFIASEAFTKTTDWGKEHILTGRPKHQIFGE
ncbi:MAG: antibiotic biosynthesis monooxygenase [candidate division Zixibacteria bacterium]|nr:antibiotic biosynthesis monooxygenase [candidate division Zixibacteria bacterium]